MIAIIPARGGSKGLPGKNTKELAGKPLIAYTIEAAKKARSVSEVIVSTDDTMIAQVARDFGASVPFMRPPELAADDSRAIDVYNYTIRRLEEERGQSIEAVVVLLPTCPLRNERDIDEAVALFESRHADSVVSYVEEQHPVYWHKRIDNALKFVEIFPEGSLKNRQEYEKTYYPNGAIYVFRSGILKKGVYYSDKSFAYIMPKERSVDIDTIDDFELAGFYLKKNAS